MYELTNVNWIVTGPSEEVDHNAVGAAISAITSNLPEMTRGVRMIAALMDDDTNGDRLLDAARHLCSAFSDMLKAAEPDVKEVRNIFKVTNKLYLLQKLQLMGLVLFFVATTSEPIERCR